LRLAGGRRRAMLYGAGGLQREVGYREGGREGGERGRGGAFSSPSHSRHYTSQSATTASSAATACPYSYVRFALGDRDTFPSAYRYAFATLLTLHTARSPVRGEPGARPVALSRVMLPSHSPAASAVAVAPRRLGAGLAGALQHAGSPCPRPAAQGACARGRGGVTVHRASGLQVVPPTAAPRVSGWGRVGCAPPSHLLTHPIQPAHHGMFVGLGG
jgi:hypothetical protein